MLLRVSRSVIQREISTSWRLKLLGILAIAGAVAIFEHPVGAQVTPDNTLGAEQSIVNSSNRDGSLRKQIEGGATRGSNLFHSFRDFNIPEGQSLYFQTLDGTRNIFSRVTGGSPSTIEGTLGVSGSTANVFLLNPNGIIFGANARLDVRGSFAATTANAIQFGDQGFFSSSATDAPPLLTVNPSALWFSPVARAAIVNRSTTPLESGGQGLQVPNGRSLLLLGGDVNLAGGGVNAAEGRVELGAIAGTGVVGLSLDDNSLRLNFPTTFDRANISLTNGATVNTSGEGGGSVQLWGSRILISGGSQVAAFTQGAKPGGNLTVNASESLDIIGLIPYGNLSTVSFGDGKAGDISINTQRLNVQDGGGISSETFGFGNGSAGELSVNASESVEVAGRDNSTGSNSFLSSSTGSAGPAGNLTVDTKKLIIRDGGVLSAESLIASENGQVFPVSGEAGNLTINASDSVELIREGLIFTGTQSPGNAGNLTINTGKLLLQDASAIVSQSDSSGNAGNITVRARSIDLKNQSRLDATTTASQGGNITLQVQDFLLLRQGSLISTTAGTAQAGGNGGNITFNGDFIVAVPKENSNISANAFSGSGGNIRITTQGLFGIEPRASATTGLSSITASSQFGISGTIALNTPDVDPIRGTTPLPTGLVDTNALISSSCLARRNRQGRFIITGTGGLATQPDDLANAAFPTYELVPDPITTANPPPPTLIVEADRAVRLSSGKIVFGRSCN
jgi:filamentous hemagglutinin family protein